MRTNRLVLLVAGLVCFSMGLASTKTEVKKFRNQGLSFLRAGELDSAMIYIQKAEIGYRELGRPKSEVAMVTFQVNIASRLGNWDSVPRLLAKGEAICQANLEDCKLVYGGLLTEKAKVKIRLQQFSSTREDIEQAIEIFAKHFKQTRSKKVFSFLLNSYIDLGTTYSQSEDLAKVINYFESGIRLYQKEYPQGDIDSLRGFADFKVAQIYHKMERYTDAMRLYKKAEERFQMDATTSSWHREMVFSCQNDKAEIYGKIGERDSQLVMLTKVIQAREAASGKPSISLATNYSNRGRCHVIMGNYPEAHQDYAQSLELYRKRLPPEHPEFARMRINLAMLAKAEGDFQQAIELSKTAYEFYKTHPGAGQAKQLAALNELGMSYLADGQLEAAAFTFDLCLKMRTGQGGHPPELLDGRYADARPSYGLVKNLGWKARALADVYKAEGDTAYLREAIRLEILAVEYLLVLDNEKWNFGRNAYYFGGSWQKYNPLLEQMLEHLSAFQEIKDDGELVWRALDLIDRTKARKVSKRLAFDGHEDSGSHPVGIARKAQEFRQAIRSENMKEWQKFKGQPTEEAGEKLEGLKFKEQLFMDSLRYHAPHIFRAIYIDLDGDCKRCMQAASGSPFVEYFAGSEHYYGFFGQGDELEILRLGTIASIDSLIGHYLDLNRSLFSSSSQEARREFALLSLQLSDELLPFRQRLAKHESLLIIPDGAIQKVPFQALLDRLPTEEDLSFYNAWPYLILAHPISYALSLQLYCQDNRGFNEVNAYAYFSPIARHGLTDLDGNALSPVDLRTADRHPVWQIFLDEKATKPEFLKGLESKAIVELMTHGVWEAQDEKKGIDNYYLGLNDGVSEQVDPLYSFEPYGFSDLQSPLLVLNECNSGDGKYIRGEGQISLNRSFRFAGIPATLSSKWEAQADVSRQILQSFYRSLQKGISKEKALHASIGDYLNSCDRAMAHPYYWSNWELYGNREPLLIRGLLFRQPAGRDSKGFLGTIALICLLGIALVAVRLYS